VNPGRASELRRYLAGYGLSHVLTGAAFGAVYWQKLGARDTLGIVFALGFIQVLVHFRCFLDIGLRRSARDALQLLLLSTLIIGLMVSGTLVILVNLHRRMM